MRCCSAGSAATRGVERHALRFQGRLAEPRSRSIERFAKVAAACPSTGARACRSATRFILNRCARATCEFAHQQGGNKKRVRALLDLLDEVDSYREGDWWAPSNGDESDDNSTDGLSRSPPSAAGLVAVVVVAAAHRARFWRAGTAAAGLRNLERWKELDRCRHVDGLMLDGPPAAAWPCKSAALSNTFRHDP